MCLCVLFECRNSVSAKNLTAETSKTAPKHTRCTVWKKFRMTKQRHLLSRPVCVLVGVQAMSLPVALGKLAAVEKIGV